MKHLALALAATLAACAPLTPNQHAALAGLAQNMATQQQITQQNAAMQQQAITAWGQTNRANAPVTCTTTWVAGTAYTRC